MSQKCKQCDLRKLGSQPVAESHVLGRSSCASRLPQVLDEWPKHHRLHVGYVPAGAGYLAKCGHHEDHLLHLVLLHWHSINPTAKVQGASSKTCRTRGCQSRWSECRIALQGDDLANRRELQVHKDLQDEGASCTSPT